MHRRSFGLAVDGVFMVGRPVFSRARQSHTVRARLVPCQATVSAGLGVSRTSADRNSAQRRPVVHTSGTRQKEPTQGRARSRPTVLRSSKSNRRTCSPNRGPSLAALERTDVMAIALGCVARPKPCRRSMGLPRSQQEQSAVAFRAHVMVRRIRDVADFRRSRASIREV